MAYNPFEMPLIAEVEPFTDVLDEADTWRGGESIHKLYPNKVAVLAGDYLIAKASVLLARLENSAVIQIMALPL